MTWRGSTRGLVLTAVTTWLIGVGACSEDEPIATAADAGVDAASGGASGSGGVAGSAGADSGCPGAPGSCDACQGDTYAGCSCAELVAACNADPNCLAIAQCALTGDEDGGPGPCLDFSEDGAACVLTCANQFPDAKAKYLALEDCTYCQFCRADCNAGDYCEALAALADAGVDAGADATDAETEASADATSDATEAGGDAASDASSDAAAD